MTAPALYGIRYVLRSTSTYAPIQAIFSLFSSQLLPACRSLFGFRCYLYICSDCGRLNWEIGGFTVHRSEVVEQKNMPACLLAAAARFTPEYEPICFLRAVPSSLAMND